MRHGVVVTGSHGYKLACCVVVKGRARIEGAPLEQEHVRVVVRLDIGEAGLKVEVKHCINGRYGVEVLRRQATTREEPLERQ